MDVVLTPVIAGRDIGIALDGVATAEIALDGFPVIAIAAGNAADVIAAQIAVVGAVGTVVDEQTPLTEGRLEFVIRTAGQHVELVR